MRLRRAQGYCVQGRIENAIKLDRVWLIPRTAERPLDGRSIEARKSREQRANLSNLEEKRLDKPFWETTYSNEDVSAFSKRPTKDVEECWRLFPQGAG
jgi:hypothetical protein